VVDLEAACLLLQVLLPLLPPLLLKGRWQLVAAAVGPARPLLLLLLPLQQPLQGAAAQWGPVGADTLTGGC